MTRGRRRAAGRAQATTALGRCSQVSISPQGPRRARHLSRGCIDDLARHSGPIPRILYFPPRTVIWAMATWSLCVQGPVSLGPNAIGHLQLPHGATTHTTTTTGHLRDSAASASRPAATHGCPVLSCSPAPLPWLLLHALRALLPCNLARPSETQRNPTCNRYIYFIPQNSPHLLFPSHPNLARLFDHSLLQLISRRSIEDPHNAPTSLSWPSFSSSSSLDLLSHSKQTRHPTMAPGGYPCPEPGCGKSFSSSSE